MKKNASDGKNGSHGPHDSHSSHNSHSSHGLHPILPPRGDYRELLSFQKTRSPEVIANIALCLINQTNYLLDQQLKRLERDFLKEGGLRERMTRARLEYRNGKNGRNGIDGTRKEDNSHSSHPIP